MILDSTSASRAMWFDKEFDETIFIDIKKEATPTIQADFRYLPFGSGIFDIVLFDPPHARSGSEGIFYKKYGSLRASMVVPTLYKAAKELFRVLKKDHFLIFKWNTHDYKLRNVLQCFPYYPLFGQKTAYKTLHASSTHWIFFKKTEKKLKKNAVLF